MKMKLDDLRIALVRAKKINIKTSSDVCEVTLVCGGQFLKLHKTNNTTYSCSKIPVENGEEFRMVIDGERLYGLIKDTAEAEITLLKNADKGIVVKFAKVNAKIPCLAVEFMLLAETSWGQCDSMVEGDTAEFKNMLRQALAFVADNKDTRTYMRGVALEKNAQTGCLRAIATNAHYLTVCESQIKLETWPKKSVIVPTEIVQAVTAALAGGQDKTVKIGIAKNKESHVGICFKTNNYHLLCPLLDSQFPNWKVIMPVNHAKQAKVNSANFHDAIKRIGNFAEGSEGHTDVFLTFKADHVLIDDGTSVQEDISEECVSLTQTSVIDGDDYWRQKFNAKLVTTALSVAPDVELDCHFCVTDDLPNKGTLLLSGIGWKSIIMPKNI